MGVTLLSLTWVGWSNGEKLAIDLRANLISTKVSASQRKSTQGQTESLKARAIVFLTNAKRLFS